MKKLNVGLVGAGFMGKAHSIGYSDMPKYFWPAPAVPVLKTICDIVPEIAADAKERFGFEKCCTDWRDIVNDPEIDVVSICTPNNVHAEIAIAALNAGTLRKADRLDIGGREGHGGGRKESGGRRQAAVYQLRRRVSSGTRLRCRETVGGNRTLGNGERLIEAPV